MVLGVEVALLCLSSFYILGIARFTCSCKLKNEQKTGAKGQGRRKDTTELIEKWGEEGQFIVPEGKALHQMKFGFEILSNAQVLLKCCPMSILNRSIFNQTLGNGIIENEGGISELAVIFQKNVWG